MRTDVRVTHSSTLRSEMNPTMQVEGRPDPPALQDILEKCVRELGDISHTDVAA